MTIRGRVLTVVFLLFVCAECLSEWTGDMLLHRLSKPMLMLILLAIFLSETAVVSHRAKIFTVLGMITGWCGDVLLMFPKELPFSLEGGLGAFLVGHCCYMIAYRTDAGAAFRPPWLLIGAFAAYCILLALLLTPYLGAMLVPLVVYACVLLLMGIVAFERKARVSVLSFRLVWVGALLFIVSDSMLAVHLFVKSSPVLGVALMVCYAGAQYGLSVGMMRHCLETSHME